MRTHTILLSLLLALTAISLNAEDVYVDWSITIEDGYVDSWCQIYGDSGIADNYPGVQANCYLYEGSGTLVTSLSGCGGEVSNEPCDLNNEPLTPGQSYYLVIDAYLDFYYDDSCPCYEDPLGFSNGVRLENNASPPYFYPADSDYEYVDEEDFYLGDIQTLKATAVSVSPTSVSLGPSQTQQFTANESVTWSVNTGSISSGGLYTAPSSISEEETATVQGCNGQDCATASVTLTPISIDISPATAELVQGQKQTYTVTVEGSSNQGVTWGLTPNVGSMSSAAPWIYTAPASITEDQTVTLTATSSADSHVTATASADLVVGSVTVTGGSAAVLTGGQTAPFDVTTVPGGLAVTWTVSAGSMDATNGVFTAPTTAGPVTLKACLQVSSSICSNMVTVNVVAPITASVSPTVLQAPVAGSPLTISGSGFTQGTVSVTSSDPTNVIFTPTQTAITATSIPGSIAVSAGAPSEYVSLTVSVAVPGLSSSPLQATTASNLDIVPVPVCTIVVTLTPTVVTTPLQPNGTLTLQATVTGKTSTGGSCSPVNGTLIWTDTYGKITPLSTYGAALYKAPATITQAENDSVKVCVTSPSVCAPPLTVPLIPGTFTISGTVEAGSWAVEGTLVSLSNGQSALTNASGAYTVTVPSLANYTVSASAPYCTMSSPYVFTGLKSNETASFTCTPQVSAVFTDNSRTSQPYQEGDSYTWTIYGPPYGTIGVIIDGTCLSCLGPLDWYTNASGVYTFNGTIGNGVGGGVVGTNTFIWGVDNGESATITFTVIQ